MANMLLMRHPLVQPSKLTRRLFSSLRAPDLEVDNIVIGAGVVGLAIGEHLCRNRRLETTFVVEKNKRIGEETSARNSEVIHAGLYYPEGSLKTRLCIKGNHMLYDLLNKTTIPFNKLGKWIVAQDADQHSYLEGMHEKAQRLCVPTHFITQGQANTLEPHIRAHSVLVSSSTGIVDSHSLMDYLEQQITEQSGDVALNTAVRSIQPTDKGYLLEMATPADSNETILVSAKRVFNSGGLHADKISNMVVGEGVYKLHYARGHYYSSSSSYGVGHLIYPCPEKNLAGLGTHLTLDMAGRIKFGPDVQYIDNPYDYSVPENEQHKAAFVKAIQQYLPGLNPEKIHPDYSGIRPKLAGPGEPFRDFIIKEEANFKNFFSLVGIESPGLTSSLAIADYVCSMIDK